MKPTSAPWTFGPRRTYEEALEDQRVAFERQKRERQEREERERQELAERHKLIDEESKYIPDSPPVEEAKVDGSKVKARLGT